MITFAKMYERTSLFLLHTHYYIMNGDTGNTENERGEQTSGEANRNIGKNGKNYKNHTKTKV